MFAFEKHELYVPKKAFYQTVDLAVEERKDTLFIDKLPTLNAKDLSYKLPFPKGMDSIAYQQLALALYDPEAKKKNDTIRYVWTVKKDSILSTKYAYPGIYVLTKDSLAPQIEALNFKDQQWVSNYKFLEMRIEDDFSGIKSYRATLMINGFSWSMNPKKIH